MRHVGGLDAILKKMEALPDEYIRRIKVAVQKTAVDVANHAKDNHMKGAAPVIDTGHAKGLAAWGITRKVAETRLKSRYENQTNVLTNSIIPRTVRADLVAVESDVGTNIEYAPHIEYGTSKSKPYPFMQPAMDANQDNFKKRTKEAIYGNA